MLGCRRQRMMRTSPAKNFMSSAHLEIVFTATGSPERRLTASYTTDDAPRPISRRSSYRSSSRAHGAVPVLSGAGWLRNRIPRFRFFSPDDIPQTAFLPSLSSDEKEKKKKAHTREQHSTRDERCMM